MPQGWARSRKPVNATVLGAVVGKRRWRRQDSGGRRKQMQGGWAIRSRTRASGSMCRGSAHLNP